MQAEISLEFTHHKMHEQLRKVVGRCLADDAQRNTRSNYDRANDLRQIEFVNVAPALTIT